MVATHRPILSAEHELSTICLSIINIAVSAVSMAQPDILSDIPQHQRYD